MHFVYSRSVFTFVIRDTGLLTEILLPREFQRTSIQAINILRHKSEPSVGSDGMKEVRDAKDGEGEVCCIWRGLERAAP